MPLTVGFVPCDLRRLDELSAEAVICHVWEDERPFRGLAGLLDWRLAGRLAGLARAGFVSGKGGEVFLSPARPKLPFDKLLLFGLGPKAAFDETTFVAALARIVRTLSGLEVRRAVLELPGRCDAAIPVDRATRLAAEAWSSAREGDSFVWVEDAIAEKAARVELDEHERRIRRSPE